MRWITSEGGPLLLLNEGNLDKWGGIDELITGPAAHKSYSPFGRPTDYDRACSVEGFIGSIAIGTEQGIVFGDEPMRTTSVPCQTECGVTIIRWVFGESENEFLKCTVDIPETLFRLDGAFAIRGPTLLLFDSALSGKNVKTSCSEFLTIELESSVYDAKTAIYQPDERTSMVVHRLIRSS